MYIKTGIIHSCVFTVEIVNSPICVYTGFGPFRANKAFDSSQEATFNRDASPAPHPQTEMLLSVRGCLRLLCWTALSSPDSYLPIV
ncbi:hypothetical protein DPMN_120507 [Dreissena polymorpha]|uniref:Uncharacterized protein n=1 Tax=Dreissena polymorpha TaxID=45954 RepID=A0A9D4JNL8_DREPO|nr:hypothetical protein DPMN_120507 [Dreissena polymorpha]